MVLLAGLYAFLWIRSHANTDSDAWRLELAEAGGTVLLASMLAFFAYVLDMLRALVLDSRRK